MPHQRPRFPRRAPTGPTVERFCQDHRRAESLPATRIAGWSVPAVGGTGSAFDKRHNAAARCPRRAGSFAAGLWRSAIWHGNGTRLLNGQPQDWSPRQYERSTITSTLDMSGRSPAARISHWAGYIIGLSRSPLRQPTANEGSPETEPRHDAFNYFPLEVNRNCPQTERSHHRSACGDLVT